MRDVIYKRIETQTELNEALELCYRILGGDDTELYGYNAWHKRFVEGIHPMVFAKENGKIVSCVMGRAENKDSLVVGFVACHEDYRRQGITKRCMSFFEELAKENEYRYITLGSKEDIFYEKCGYKVINNISGQNIYQKVIG